MSEKTPSITFQNRMDIIIDGYRELGNLAIRLNEDVVKLLDDYDESLHKNIPRSTVPRSFRE